MATMYELIENEEFVQKLETVNSLEEASALFAAEGVSVTVDELKAQMNAPEGSEFTESELDEVTGGLVITGPTIGIKLAAAIVKAVLKATRGGGGHKF